MAQLKDLVVNGPARVIGKSYASTFVGPLDGLASSATNDKNGNDITNYVNNVATASGGNLVITKGDGSTSSMPVSSTAADYASSATADASGHNIEDNYIAELSISANNLTYKNGKGASTGITIEMASSATTATNAGTATYASSAGVVSSATYDATGHEISENLASLEISNGVVTTTKANGATASQTIDKASSATQAVNASTASYDTEGNLITDYVKNFSINSNRITVTKGNGSTAEETITYASSAASAASASVDDSGNTISEYIKSISVNNNTMTLTKGNGSTVSQTIDNVSSASSATVAGSASSATYDTNNNNISSYIKSISISNNTMTLTKGDGSTVSETIAKASSATVADSASTAERDTSGNNISSYIKSVSKDGANLVFTKGDGSTFSEEVGSDVPNASSTTAGISKLYASTGSNSDGSMTQESISSYVSELRGLINGITGFRIDIPVTGELPETGEDGVLYLIPIEDSEEADNLYEEYVWVTIPGEGEDPDTSYFEKIGATTLDLSGYYTSTEVTNITNNLVKTITINNNILTVTDGDNTASTLSLDKASSADLASSATMSTFASQDASSQAIDETYIKTVAISNNTMTLTKGNGSTSSLTVEAASSASLASSANMSSQDAAGQTIDSTYLKGISIENNTMTLTKGNGSTSSITIQAASSAGFSTLADASSFAHKDAASQTIDETYIKGISIANNTMTLTKGNGSTSSITIEKASSATHAEFAEKDAASQTISSTYIKGISISNNTLTLTRGNGSTMDVTIEKASSATTATNAGTATYATNAGTAVYAAAASTAMAIHLDGASTADNAIEDGTLVDFGAEDDCDSPSTASS